MEPFNNHQVVGEKNQSTVSPNSIAYRPWERVYKHYYYIIRGEKDLNTIATENNIQPNLLRNWKKEFLNNASVVFDDKREENLKEKLAEERKEKAAYAKKVGQLTMQVDWLKKKSEEICGPDYESKFSPKPFDD